MHLSLNGTHKFRREGIIIVGSEYRESPPDSSQEYHRAYHHGYANEAQSSEAHSGGPSFDSQHIAETPQPTAQSSSHYEDYPGSQYREPVYREHVSGFLGSPYAPPTPQAHNGQASHQPVAPFHPGAHLNQPYQPYYPQGYYPYGQPQYVQGYYGYPGPYGYAQPKPSEPGRTYQLVISIVTIVGASLAFLGGLISLFFLIFTSVIFSATSRLPEDQRFQVVGLFSAFAFVGIIGGVACGYHSIMAMLKRPSWAFKLPPFWTFLILYVVLIGIAVAMAASGIAVASAPLTIFLIALAGIFPALTIIALAMRHIRKPKTLPWPTTWRRFIVALVSGATLSISLALVLELLLGKIVQQIVGASGNVLDNPNQLPSDSKGIIALLLTIAVIAPLVEEAVKPLAALTMLGRIRNAAEAFVVGMGCGIGFGLVETVMYISSGYQDWLQIALLRSTACLLHGMGAGMVTLGWYYISHKGSMRKLNRIILGIGCAIYAVIQHAIWNGSAGLALLPFFPKDNLQLGPFSLSPDWAMTPVYIILSALMILFLLFVTRRLRPQTQEQASDTPTRSQGQPPNFTPRPAPIG